MSSAEREYGNGKRMRILGVLVLGILALSVFFGRYPKPYWMPPSYLLNDELARRLILHLRLPRILTAFLMGMALAAAGVVMQTVFRNPLVSSGFLGISQGAAFGAAFGIIFLGSSAIVIELSATAFAIAALAVSYLLASRIHYGNWVLRLVLAGIVSGAFFSSGVGVLKYLADPLKQLPDIVFWLMGGLWSVTWREFFYILPVVTVSLVILYLMRWRLNLLGLSDATAFSLGSSLSRERGLVLAASVVATAVVVAVAGVVGWVGLIVPHIARRIVGADTQRVLPASMLIGGVFALVCDNLARALRAGEIPLGIVTSLMGALVFVVMFSRKSVGVRR